jgi:hypothetical protein
LESERRHYWRFYWPLSLMGAVALAGRFAQNYVLLGYREGVRELAVFALALSVLHPFRGVVLGFMPHMTNVLVRGPASLRAVLRFLLALCVLSTVPVLLLGWTPIGPALLARIFSVSGERIARIVEYMRYFSPLIPLGGASSFLIGMLVQARRTGVVSVLHALHLVLVVVVLVAGVRLGWSPVATLSLSLLLPQAAHAVMAGALLLRFRRPFEPDRDEALTQKSIASYFLPLAATTMLFTLSRPIIFALLTTLNPAGDPALPAVEPLIAAVSLAFTFSMVFQSAVNQFRHLFVTFGRRDREGVRRFMIRTGGVVTVLMLVCVASPLAGLFFRHLQGASGETLEMAIQALWPLCLVPVVIGLRNYFHGLAMVHRRTLSMTAGSLMRNVAIVAVGAALLHLGAYNHLGATATLIVGFSAEAFTVFLGTRGLRADLADGRAGASAEG